MRRLRSPVNRTTDERWTTVNTSNIKFFGLIIFIEIFTLGKYCFPQNNPKIFGYIWRKNYQKRALFIRFIPYFMKLPNQISRKKNSIIFTFRINYIQKIDCKFC